jgi:hypothetical protein
VVAERFLSMPPAVLCQAAAFIVGGSREVEAISVDGVGLDDVFLDVVGFLDGLELLANCGVRRFLYLLSESCKVSL